MSPAARVVDLARAVVPLPWVGVLLFSLGGAAAAGLRAYDRFTAVETGLAATRSELAGLSRALAAAGFSDPSAAHASNP